MKKAKIRKLQKGLTLVEVAAAAVILMVVVLGTLNFRYYATLDIEKSKNHLDAVELAAVMCHGWQGVDGAETFDPATTFAGEMNIANGTGEDAPDGYSLLGKYDVVSESTTYHLTMSYNDYDANLRQLNIIVSWPFGGDNNEKAFRMTGYVYRN